MTSDGFCPVGKKFCKVYKKLGKPCGKKPIKEGQREFCHSCVDCDYPFRPEDLEKLGTDFVSFLINSGIYR
jgi:hypothetical protein